LALWVVLQAAQNFAPNFVMTPAGIIAAGTEALSFRPEGWVDVHL
jgi:hypothetical protein